MAKLIANVSVNPQHIEEVQCLLDELALCRGALHKLEAHPYWQYKATSFNHPPEGNGWQANKHKLFDGKWHWMRELSVQSQQDSLSSCPQSAVSQIGDSDDLNV